MADQMGQVDRSPGLQNPVSRSGALCTQACLCVEGEASVAPLPGTCLVSAMKKSTYVVWICLWLHGPAATESE